MPALCRLHQHPISVQSPPLGCLNTSHCRLQLICNKYGDYANIKRKPKEYLDRYSIRTIEAYRTSKYTINTNKWENNRHHFGIASSLGRGRRFPFPLNLIMFIKKSSTLSATISRLRRQRALVSGRINKCCIFVYLFSYFFLFFFLLSCYFVYKCKIYTSSLVSCNTLICLVFPHLDVKPSICHSLFCFNDDSSC